MKSVIIISKGNNVLNIILLILLNVQDINAAAIQLLSKQIKTITIQRKW
jgi:hypothetical protein